MGGYLLGPYHPPQIVVGSHIYETLVTYEIPTLCGLGVRVGFLDYLQPLKLAQSPLEVSFES